MLVNKTVEFFLSEVAGRGGMPARAEAGCRRGPRLGQAAGLERSGTGRDAGEKITGQTAGLERLGTGRDADEGRGWGWDEMPATKSHGQVADSERPGTGRDARLGRRRENQLKRKRSIISSSNSGFSKSFSLVMIKLLCSQNPASW